MDQDKDLEQMPLEGIEPVADAPSETVQEVDQDGLPKDNAARTSLGRKLTRYEQQMQEMKSSLERMNDMLMRQMEERTYAPPARQSFPEPEAVDEDAVVTTYRDVKRMQEIEKARESRANQEYQNSYIKHVRTRPFMVKDTPPDLHAEIEREMLADNIVAYARHTDDPRKDAEINYGLAKARVLEKRYREAVSKPNVLGDKKVPPTGMTSATRAPAAPVKQVQLDEYASKFVKALGKTPDDEWVQKVLKDK